MYKLKKQYRLYGYDYSSSGHYFVTIVTKDREKYFGEIVNGEMIYSKIGLFVKENISKFLQLDSDEETIKSNPHYILQKDNIFVVENWVIMPNHVHLLIQIINRIEREPMFHSGIGPLKKGSLGAFINGFKGIIQRYATKNDIPFKWQARFHDRIVRDQNEFDNIISYISGNIENWERDRENV